MVMSQRVLSSNLKVSSGHTSRLTSLKGMRACVVSSAATSPDWRSFTCTATRGACLLHCKSHCAPAFNVLIGVQFRHEGWYAAGVHGKLVSSQDGSQPSQMMPLDWSR